MSRLLLALILACAPAWAHLGPHPEAGVAFDQRIGERVDTSLPFTDARGRDETLASAIANKPTVLLLGYVRCRDLCSLAVPATVKALDDAGLAAGRDYRAIFASIDAREGPGALAQGLERIPIADRNGWTFLGVNEASSKALAERIGFHYRYEPERDAFAHPEGVIVLSPDGRISRYLFGMRFEPRDVRLAIAEAEEGRSGSVANQLLLLCYHFDPTTGRYSLTILNALRALIAVCAVMAAFFAWRRVRARAPRGGTA